MCQSVSALLPIHVWHDKQTGTQVSKGCGTFKYFLVFKLNQVGQKTAFLLD